MSNPSTRYLKFPSGYAKAVWVKSRKRYRMRYLWTSQESLKVEDTASSLYWTHEAVDRLRTLKNRPSFKMVREQELDAASRMATLSGASVE